MSWHPGQITLRKVLGKHIQNPIEVAPLGRNDLPSFADDKRLTTFCASRGLDQDRRPHVANKKVKPYKWKPKKAKKPRGGDGL